MMYRYEVRHSGLHKFQVVRGQTDAEARAKAEARMAAWEVEFARIQLREAKRIQLDYRKTLQAARKEEAAERTREAEREIDNLTSFLRNAIDRAKPFDFSTLKLDKPFAEAQPTKPQVIRNPIEPKQSDSDFAIKFGLLDHIFRWRMRRKRRAAGDRFAKAHTDWVIECERNNNWNNERTTKYN
jgi:hypothetical protein